MTQLLPVSGSPTSSESTSVELGTSDSARVPHSLSAAFQALIALLDQEIAEYQPPRPYGHGHEVCEGVRRFTHEFCRVPAWQFELQRRAGFIEEACKQEAPFRKAMDSALRALHDHPPRPAGPGISSARLSIQRLRNVDGRFQSLHDVKRLRQTLDWMLLEGIVPLKAQPYVRKSREACTVVELDARNIEADGCSDLWHVDQAWKADTTEWSLAIEAFLQSKFGALCLGDLKAAAVSLMAWAREQPKSVFAPPASQLPDKSDDPAVCEEPIDGDGGAEVPLEPRPFTGDTLVFFTDRVELCGVAICSGSRSRSQRQALELLRIQREDGNFASYSGEELVSALNLRSNSAAGVIRDLRARITEALRTVNIDCGKDDVILSGGQGYRLSDKLSVQVNRDTNQGQRDELQHGDVPDSDVPDVPNGDVPDVPDVPDSNVPNDPDGNVPDGAPAIRQRWILNQLREGVRLKRRDVVDQFDVSNKTAKRDFSALKSERKVEVAGSGPSSYYRLCDHAKCESSR